jgi:hypothetical protein
MAILIRYMKSAEAVGPAAVPAVARPVIADGEHQGQLSLIYGCSIHPMQKVIFFNT